MKEIKRKPCGESSPYWDWVITHAFFDTNDQKYYERISANADIVATPESQIDKQLESLLEVLDEGGEQVLSKREKQVFQFHLREGLSEAKTARNLGISRRACREHIKRIASKMRRLCSPKVS